MKALFIKKTQSCLSNNFYQILKRWSEIFLLFLFVCSLFLFEAHAQTSSTNEEDDFIQPARPGVTTSAEIQNPVFYKSNMAMNQIFVQILLNLNNPPL